MANGILQEKELIQIWKEYNPSVHKKLFMLLRQFGVIFELTEVRTDLVMSILDRVYTFHSISKRSFVYCSYLLNCISISNQRSACRRLISRSHSDGYSKQSKGKSISTDSNTLLRSDSTNDKNGNVIDKFWILIC